MEILNLYAGIGGNRKLWGNEHNVTSIEYREDIADVYRSYFPNDNLIVTDAHNFLLENYRKFDFIWSSPPCQTHSRARYWAAKAETSKTKSRYPDMKLYQEILFLQHYCNKLWVVENVIPFYTPIIQPTVKLGRHLFWSNFKIQKIETTDADINKGVQEDWSRLLGFDLSKFKFKTRKDQIYRNTVVPELGLHILNCALKKHQKKDSQLELF